MYKQFSLATVVFFVTVNVSAQDQPRKMTLVRGESADRGKCTLEVEVDGAATVEIRGDTATLHNISGALPRWRRFECTGPLPRNPEGFRFAGVDGRGHQQLLRDPREGGAAIVRIEDGSGGSEGYTFDIMWGNAPRPVQDRVEGQQGNYIPEGHGPASDRDREAFHRGREDAFRRDDWRMHLFARIREDLDYVRKITLPFGRDGYRLERATEELDQLQKLQARGRYDPRELDDVVNALRRVVSDNRLSSMDREALKDDLKRLQDFRAHFREYGVQ
jgi:hypothetical protein